MNNELREAQKVEALLRMKKLNLLDEVVNFFKKGKVLKSERSKLGNIIMPIVTELSEQEYKFVKEIEKRYGILIYHITNEKTEFGELLDMFYVSKHTEDWQSDDELLNENFQYCYVKNVDDDMCSEFGGIEFKSVFGGLIRVA